MQLEEDFSTSVWQQKLSGLVLSDDDPSNLWFLFLWNHRPPRVLFFWIQIPLTTFFIDYQPALNFHGTDQFFCSTH